MKKTPSFEVSVMTIFWQIIALVAFSPFGRDDAKSMAKYGDMIRKEIGVEMNKETAETYYKLFTKGGNFTGKNDDVGIGIAGTYNIFDIDL